VSKLNLLKKLITPRFAEYLILDRDFIVQEISSGIQKYADFPYRVNVGDDARLAFPELIGSEVILSGICDIQTSQFEIEGILREHDRGKLIYFNLYTICISDREIDIDSQFVLLCLEDVTEKMILRQELLHRSNETQLLLQQLSIAKAYSDKIISCMADLLIVTTSNGTIKLINPAAESILGYSADQLIDRPFASIVSNKSILPYLDKKELVKDLEVACLNKEGIQVILSLSCATLEVQSLDLPQSVLAILESSSDQDRIYVGRRVPSEELAQRQLRTLATRLSILLEHLPQGILLEDEVGRLLVINAHLCQIFEINPSPQSLLGTESIQATDAWRSRLMDPELFVGQIQTLVAARQKLMAERIQLKNGNYLERDYIPINIDGTVFGHLWQFRLIDSGIDSDIDSKID
jgi:PAS domain-containing protein